MELREVAKDKFNAIANKFICKNFFKLVIWVIVQNFGEKDLLSWVS